MVITDANKKDWDLTVGPDAKVTIDGKAGKIGDVKAGDSVAVYTDKDGKVIAIDVKPD